MALLAPIPHNLASTIFITVCKKLEAYMFSNGIKFMPLFMKIDQFCSKVNMGKYSGDCITKRILKKYNV